MAKKKSRQDELFERLRAVGLRKQVARTLAKAGEKADSKRLRKAVDDLRGLVSELESRVGGVAGGTPEDEPRPAPKRSSGAPERAATTTRGTTDAKRSAAAKKAAATRAANRARAADGTGRSTPERATTTPQQRTSTSQTDDG